MNEARGKAEVIIAKQRHGPTGTVGLASKANSRGSPTSPRIATCPSAMTSAAGGRPTVPGRTDRLSIARRPRSGASDGRRTRPSALYVLRRRRVHPRRTGRCQTRSSLIGLVEQAGRAIGVGPALVCSAGKNRLAGNDRRRTPAGRARRPPAAANCCSGSARMVKGLFVCQSCGAAHPGSAGRCGACGAWNPLPKQARPAASAPGRRRRRGPRRRTRQARPAGARSSRAAGGRAGGPRPSPFVIRAEHRW